MMPRSTDRDCRTLQTQVDAHGWIPQRKTD
jgi:hypothetical protein